MPNLFKTLLVVVAAGLVAGCAAPPKVLTYKLTEKKRWEPGQGPLVSEVIQLPQESIVTVAKRGSTWPVEKTKFETDEEFKKRSAALQKPVFVVADITTSKEANCESTYDHEKSLYKVKQCLPFLSSRPLITEQRYGESFGLANAYDSRTIRRKIWDKYFLAASVDWADEFKLPKDTAQVLDKELMAGLVIKNPSTTSKCSLCNLRELEDSVLSLSKSASGRTSKGWKDQAFLDGEVLEDWDYTVATGGMNEMIVFRKSDQRVLYHAKYVLSAQEK